MENKTSWQLKLYNNLIGTLKLTLPKIYLFLVNLNLSMYTYKGVKKRECMWLYWFIMTKNACDCDKL